EVVRDRSRCADRGDGVLEDELIAAIDFDDDREPIEILDARVELTTVEQVNDDGETIAARVIEEHVLDVGLRCGRSLFSDLGHQEPSPRHPCMASASSTRRRTSSRSPGPSNHLRLGSLRNQINWRRAYRRFSWTMSARVSASPRTPRSISITCRYTRPPNGLASGGTPRASNARTSSTMPRAHCSSTRRPTRSAVSAAGNRRAYATISQSAMGD